MRHLKRASTVTSILIAAGTALTFSSPSFAAEEFDFTQCIHPKPGALNSSASSQFTIADTEFSKNNGLLGSTFAGDPLNLSTDVFNSVELGSESSDEELIGGAINFTTGTAESRVSISGQRAFSQGNGNARYLTLEFSAPAAKTGDTELTQLGEFASDAQVKFSFFQTFGGWKVTPLNSKRVTDIKTEVLNGIEEICGDKCPEAVKKGDANGIMLSTDCVAKYATKKNENTEFFFNNQVERTASTFLGGSASIGYKEFEFKDLAADKDVSEDKVPWSLEVFAGRYSADRETLFRAGYTYVEDYKASDKITLCQASEQDAMGAQVCENLTTSGPEDDQKDVGFIEMRKKLNGSIVQAATVKLSYDFDDKETEVDIPIYLLTDGEKNLNGGIRLGWSESDDIKFGVFVGSTFSLSGG